MFWKNTGRAEIFVIGRVIGGFDANADALNIPYRTVIVSDYLPDERKIPIGIRHRVWAGSCPRVCWIIWRAVIQILIPIEKYFDSRHALKYSLLQRFRRDPARYIDGDRRAGYRL